MAQNTTVKLPTPAPVAPEVLREQLLRPFPKIGWRVIIILVLAIALIGWSISGTQTSFSTLAEGLPDIWNFILRLFPAEFEWQRGTERTIINGGVETSVPLIGAEDIIRRAYDGVDAHLVFDESGRAVGSEINVLIKPNTTGIYLRNEAGEPIPVRQRDLAQTISLMRNAGMTDISYIVGAWGLTFGYPIILTSILETIQMAIIGTIGAVLLSIPLALLAARNVSPAPQIYQTTRMILNLLRSIPELIYALIFVAAVGLGPFPGVLAIIFGSIGSLSRLFAEAIEQIDPQQVLAVQATGASGLHTFTYSVIPQALPLLISYSLVYFEHNVRNATILGLVGAGGVGFELSTYLSLFQYDKVMGTVIILVLAVTVIDRFSSSVRSRFI